MTALIYKTTYPEKIFYNVLLSLSVFFFTHTLNGGTIRGTVRAKATNEPIIGASINLQKNKLGTVSDQSGLFKIEHIPEGEYSLRVDMIGYKKIKIKEVEIESDTEVVNVDIRMEEAPVNIGEVVIRARVDRELESSGIQSEFQANNIICKIIMITMARSSPRLSLLQHSKK